MLLDCVVIKVEQNFFGKSRMQALTTVGLSQRTSDKDNIVEAKFSLKIFND